MSNRPQTPSSNQSYINHLEETELELTALPTQVLLENQPTIYYNLDKTFVFCVLANYKNHRNENQTL